MARLGLRKLVAHHRQFTLTTHERCQGTPPEPKTCPLLTDETIKWSGSAFGSTIGREFEVPLQERSGCGANEDAVGLTDIAESGKYAFSSALVLEIDLCAAIDPIHQQLRGVNRDLDACNTCVDPPSALSRVSDSESR